MKNTKRKIMNDHKHKTITWEYQKLKFYCLEYLFQSTLIHLTSDWTAVTEGISLIESVKWKEWAPGKKLQSD